VFFALGNHLGLEVIENSLFLSMHRRPHRFDPDQSTKQTAAESSEETTAKIFAFMPPKVSFMRSEQMPGDGMEEVIGSIPIRSTTQLLC
jgi:hypothetical protein